MADESRPRGKPLPPLKRKKKRATDRKARKTLTVRYWRIVDLRDGHNLQSSSGAAVDWSAHLGRLGDDPIPYAAGLTARVYPTADAYKLVLSKDRDFAQRQRDRSGNARPMVLDNPDNEPIEDSFVSFLPGHNAFAMATSGRGAPPATTVAGFLASQNIPRGTGTFLSVEPVVDPDRFRRATEKVKLADWVTVAVRMPRQGQRVRGLLSSIAGMRGEVGDDVIVDITVRAADGPESRETRTRLYDFARQLNTDLSRQDLAISDAQVKIPGETGAIDLVKDELAFTVSRQIEVRGTDRCLNEATVFSVIDEVTDHQAAERLRRALGAS